MERQKATYLSALMTLFGRNWITLSGAVLAGISAVFIITFMVLGMLQIADSPYIGIMAFLVLPGVFVAGLLIVPLGVLYEHRYGTAATEDGKAFPVIDFNNPHTRRVGALVAVFTMFNLLIIGTATYAGVHFMDSVTFCGEVCHTVMEPQHTAYLKSPHQRVACVECHIGPGADWFVKSKLSGLRQVFAVALNTYPRPVPSPVEDLRPSMDTCEQCHWPQKFTGDHLKILTRYQEDEENTPLDTVLLMHIGGGDDGGTGIHSVHINSGKQVYYRAADPKRQVMAEVRVVDGEGQETIYRAPEGSLEEGHEVAEERMMDCIDCHNRPSHIFKLPAEEVNTSLKMGRLDDTLPYIRKVGVDILTNATGKEGDLAQIAREVRAYYQENYPDVMEAQEETVLSAISELQEIYKSNVFPNMNLFWGSHPNNIGHEDFPGCFRCHNDTLRTEEGKTIGQDCEGCHTILAWDEYQPEILQLLGH